MRVMVQEANKLTNVASGERIQFLQGYATAINKLAGSQLEVPVIHRKLRGQRYLGTLSKAEVIGDKLFADLTPNSRVTEDDVRSVGIEVVV